MTLPVSMQQLIDAGVDCGTIASIATSTSETVVDRLGQVKQTVKGAVDTINTRVLDQLNRIGFEQPTVYSTSGQTLLRQSQTVVYSGAVYAPAFTTVFPFISSGAFNPSLWRVVSSVDSSSVISNIQVNKYADFSTFTPTFDGQIVNLSCKNTIGDGGGGEWYYSAASTLTPDGGSIAACAISGRMLRDISKGVYVSWWGSDASALQSAANRSNVVRVSKGSEVNIGSTTVNFNLFASTIIGEGGMYSGGVIRYSGSGIALNFGNTSQYNTCKHFTLICDSATTTNFYDTGTVGINLVASNVVMEDCRISGFEYLVQSNYDSYYNKFIDNRFERAKIILNKFSVNNLEAKGNRCKEFNTFARTAGNNGPFSLTRNSFEVFNGNIILTTELSHVIAKENYIETYYTTPAPTNFPVNPTGYFTDAILFAGEYCVLDIENNNIDMRGARRIVNATVSKRLYCRNNDITDFDTSAGFSSFVDQLYSVGSSCEDVYINDQLNALNGNNTLVNPSRTRTQSFIARPSPQSNFYYFDAIQKSEFVSYTNPPVQLLSLQNGWVNDSTTANKSKLRYTDNGVLLSGVIEGGAAIANVICTIPLAYRPMQQSDTTYFRFKVFNNYGDSPSELITLRYLYGNGVIQMETSPTSKSKIVLDGILIPHI